MDDATLVKEEIECLSSIYIEEWKCGVEESAYSMRINRDVTLFVNFVPGYPSNRPPKYELLAPSVSKEKKKQIAQEFKRIFGSNCGQPVIFQWVERLKELVYTNREKPVVAKVTEKIIVEVSRKFDDVVHGPIIQDRKSVFQGHACPIASEKDVKCFIRFLLENKKIGQAKHNVSAFRVKLPNGVLLQDCDDDGEKNAGGRLLKLLNMVNVVGYAVVVTRWFGGINLGADRFKHYSNAARQALVEASVIR